MVRISTNLFVFLLQNRAFKISATLTFILLGLLKFNAAVADNEVQNGTKVKVAPGTYIVSVKDFLINDGAVYTNNGSLLLKKNIINDNVSPSPIGNVSFKGIALQTMSGQNIIQGLTIDNPSGILINGNTRINESLTLTAGSITIDAFNLTFGPSMTLTGDFSSSRMIVATGTGELRKSFSPGFAGNFVFPVGDKTGTAEYSPVTLNFTAGTFGLDNYIGVNLRNSKYNDPSVTDNYLNRYWKISQSGVTGFNCSATFQYVPADVVGSEDLIIAKRVEPLPVLTYGPANITTHQLTASAVTEFGTYTGSSQSMPSLTGPTVACKDATGNVYTTDANKSNYVWTISSGGVITAGGTSTSNTVTVKWVIPGPQSVSVTYAGASGTAVLNVTVQGPTLSGNTDVCKLTTQMYTTQPGMTNYNWIINGGLKVGGGGPTSNMIMVYWIGVGSRYVKVTYTNGSCTSTTTLPVNVHTSSPTISGPSSACLNLTSNYSTDEGMQNYVWTVSPGGTIVGPANTDQVQVLWQATGYQYVYCIYTSPYGCPITKTTFKVTVWDLPTPVITGPETILQGETALYTTQSGMYNYTWGVSSGGVITSGGSGYAYAQIVWQEAGQQFVSLNYANQGLCSATNPTILNVLVNPGSSAPIHGQNTSDGKDIISGIEGNQIGQDSPGIVIRPVPNNGKFIISINGNNAGENYSISIYNYLGMEVYQLKDIQVQGSLNLPVDISHVSEGVYMVFVRNAQNQASKRIIIRK